MRIPLTFLTFLLLASNFGGAQQQNAADSCGFVVQGKETPPTIKGPDDIVPLVYVVEQPDSPLEVVSADLTGTWLSVANEQHTERDCATYNVHNRSDRPVQAFEIRLQISAFHGGGGFGTRPTSPLAPGQVVEVKSCGSRGHGGAPGNHVKLLISVESVDFGDCFYRPSVRIPRSLGVQPW